MKVRPEEELKIDVNGYSNVNPLGCDNDCQQYFEKVSAEIDNCGWYATDNTWPLW